MGVHEPRQESELTQHLGMLRRRWRWLLLPVLLGLLLGHLVSQGKEERFTARTEVLLGDTAAQEAIGDISQSSSFRARLVENELSLAESDAALAEVSGLLGSQTRPAGLSVSADSSADVLVFAATSTAPELAADAANLWAEAYVELKQEEERASLLTAITRLQDRLLELQLTRLDTRAALVELQDEALRAEGEAQIEAQLLAEREESRISGEVTIVDAQIAAIVASISDLEVSADLALNGSARIVRRAIPPSEPSSPPASRFLALGLIAGCIAGVSLAVLRDSLDRRIRDADDIQAIGLLQLGSVPKANRRAKHSPAAIEEPDGIQAEAAQKLQAAIQFLIASDKLESIVVTSPRQGDGKTTTAANLAVAMARAGKRTLLIDADLRRPRVHKIFAIPQSPGLTNVALDPSVLSSAAKVATSISESLVVVPAGELPPHPAGFIATSLFGAAIDDLESMADITIIDAAPVLPVADTLSLAAHADGVLMVARAGVTTRDDLADSVESVRNAGGTIIGTALIGASAKDKSNYNYSAEDEPLDRMAPPHANGSGAGARKVADDTATASPN